MYLFEIVIPNPRPNLASFPWGSNKLLVVSTGLPLLLLTPYDMDVLQFNCSLTEGHLGSFQFGAIMNTADMKFF